MVKRKKITILGAGKVGASIAFGMISNGTASEIVLVDIAKDKAEGEVIDMLQSAVFAPAVKVINGDYADAKDSDIVVVTLGIARKPGQTRIDLANINIGIIKSVIPEITKAAPNAMYVVVSNPIDILTYAMHKYSGLPANQIIGSGTLLDTARLDAALAQYMGVGVESVHSYVLGEHGDSSMVPWSIVNVAGCPIKSYLKDFCGKDEAVIDSDLEEIRKNMTCSGATIIKLKGATYYGIALSVRKICETILRDADAILPVSCMMDGEYGISDVCLSIPCYVNGKGIARKLPFELTESEVAELVNSANALKTIISQLDM